jgi:mycothiol system anti-sigma-R factor
VSCGDPHDLDCREVLDRVFELLDGEMPPADVDTFRQHLDECAPCLSEYELDVVMKALIRRSCPCEQAPEELRARILVRISQTRLELG